MRMRCCRNAAGGGPHKKKQKQKAGEAESKQGGGGNDKVEIGSAVVDLYVGDSTYKIGKRIPLLRRNAKVSRVLCAAIAVLL